LLSPGRRGVRPELPGAPRGDRLGAIRARTQPEVRAVPGPLRVRADRGRGHPLPPGEGARGRPARAAHDRPVRAGPPRGPPPPASAAWAPARRPRGPACLPRGAAAALGALLPPLLHRPSAFAFFGLSLLVAGRHLGARRVLSMTAAGYGIAWASEVSSIHTGF